jgi:diguanylate cyclase (GGDEF)-like protein
VTSIEEKRRMTEAILLRSPAPPAVPAGTRWHAHLAPAGQRGPRPLPPPHHVDAVTGLLNRSGIVAAVSSLIESASARRAVGALLCIDLGGPEALAGLAEGRCPETRDTLLRDVADALREAVRGADAVGHLGGDDFVVVLEGLGDLANAGRIADAVMQALRRLPTSGAAEGLCPRIGVTRLPQSPRAAASMFAARARAVGAR